MSLICDEIRLWDISIVQIKSSSQLTIEFESKNCAGFEQKFKARIRQWLYENEDP